jgi:hypothetical protein
VVTHNHNLEELSIYCSSKLSSRAIKLVAEHCPNLQVRPSCPAATPDRCFRARPVWGPTLYLPSFSAAAAAFHCE